MQILNNTNTVFGGFFVRLAAYLVDIILVGAVLMTIRFPMWIITIMNPDNLLTTPVLFQYSTWNIIIYLLNVIYFVAMTYFTGRTIGKRLFHLKVVTSSNEEVKFLNVLYRETIGRFLSSLMFLGYLLVCVDQDKRGFHDILCDTRVVYTNTVFLNGDSTSKETISINNITKDTISNNAISNDVISNDN